MTRIFLAIVGALYVFLAGWCAVQPVKTAKSIGYDLVGGGGLSEYVTVYGGIQLALALIFLWPLYRVEDTNAALAVCLVVHASLVVFRTAGFFMFGDIPSTTYYFAASEWVILLISGYLYYAR